MKKMNLGKLSMIIHILFDNNILKTYSKNRPHNLSTKFLGVPYFKSRNLKPYSRDYTIHGHLSTFLISRLLRNK